MAAEVLTTDNAAALVSGGTAGPAKWMTVTLSMGVVIYPKDGERRVGKVGEVVTLNRWHALELIEYGRAAEAAEQAKPKKKEQ